MVRLSSKRSLYIVIYMYIVKHVQKYRLEKAKRNFICPFDTKLPTDLSHFADAVHRGCQIGLTRFNIQPIYYIPVQPVIKQ